jgi:hypothetical protein
LYFVTKLSVSLRFRATSSGERRRTLNQVHYGPEYGPKSAALTIDGCRVGENPHV